MHYSLKMCTVALSIATMILATAAEKISSRSLKFSVSQLANPEYTGSSGVLAMAKTYTKYGKTIPTGLKKALSQEFPVWGEYYKFPTNTLALIVERQRASNPCWPQFRPILLGAHYNWDTAAEIYHGFRFRLCRSVRP